jgi:hypothetical protein
VPSSRPTASASPRSSEVASATIPRPLSHQGEDAVVVEERDDRDDEQAGVLQCLDRVGDAGPGLRLRGGRKEQERGEQGDGWIFFGWGLCLTFTSIWGATWLEKKFGTFVSIVIALVGFAACIGLMAVFPNGSTTTGMNGGQPWASWSAPSSAASSSASPTP